MGKDTTKHDGGHGDTRRTEILERSPDHEPGKDEPNPGIPRRSNQKPQNQRTRGLPRRKTQLHGWQAQLIVYYRTVGCKNIHDEENILCATSPLRDDAGTWITPYAEKQITPTWDTWA